MRPPLLLPVIAGTETYQYTFVFKVSKAGLVAVKK